MNEKLEIIRTAKIKNVKANSDSLFFTHAEPRLCREARVARELEDQLQICSHDDS